MKKFFLVLVLLLSFSLFASVNNARMIPSDSSLYDNMDAIYTLLGYPRPSTSRPWSVSEARMIFSRINKDSLKPNEINLYNAINDELESHLRWSMGDDLSLTVDAEVNTEGYFHTNSEDFVKEGNWERGYNERKSLLVGRLELSLWDFFYTTADLHYRYGRFDVKDEAIKYGQSGKLVPISGTDTGYVGSYVVGNNIIYQTKSAFFSPNAATNIALPTHFTFYFPRRASISVGGEKWNINWSREHLEIGNANVFNLFIDDEELSDYLQFSFFGKSFKYNFITMFLPTETSNAENTPNKEGRTYLIHTLEFRLFDKVSFTISENVMYKYNTFEMGFLNPSNIFHNLNNRSMFNSLAFLEVNYAFLPGFEVYGQFVMDQARALFENGYQEDASGFILGLKWTKALQSGILTTFGEFAYTTPLLYRRDKVDFLRVNRDMLILGLEKEGSPSVGGGFVPYFTYIGFPYGGDVVMGEVSSTFKSYDNWDSSLYFRYLAKGEMNMYHSHAEDGNNDDMPNYKGKTPSGNITKNVILIGNKGSYNFKALFKYPEVEVYGEVDLLMKWNYNKTTRENSSFAFDSQFTLGASFIF